MTTSIRCSLCDRSHVSVKHKTPQFSSHCLETLTDSNVSRISLATVILNDEEMSLRARTCPDFSIVYGCLLQEEGNILSRMLCIYSFIFLLTAAFMIGGFLNVRISLLSLTLSCGQVSYDLMRVFSTSPCGSLLTRYGWCLN